MSAPEKPTLSLVSAGSTYATIGASYPDPYVVYGTQWQRKIVGGTFADIYSGDSGARGSDTSSDLQDGTGYVWRMRSYNSYAQYSAWSDELTALTILPTPTGVSYTAGPTTCTFRWNDSSQNESGFWVFRTQAGGSTFSLLTTKEQNVTSHYDSGLTPGQWYKYYVVAYNASTNSLDSSIVQVFTADPPNAPSGLSLTVTGTTKVRANWTDNADNENGFTVEWGTDGVTFGSTHDVGANVTTYEITGLTSNITYFVRVKAINASGGSAYCSAASAATWAAIAKPTNLKATPWGSGTLEITFDDNSELETDHRLERRVKWASPSWLTDGGLESWNSSTDLTNWTEATAGSSSINRDNSTVHAGIYSARGWVDGAGSQCYFYQTVTAQTGVKYTVSFWYIVPAGKTLFLEIKNSGSNVWLKSDGTWNTTTDYVSLPSTSGSWAQFSITFTSHASYNTYIFYLGHYPAWTPANSLNNFYIDDIQWIDEFDLVMTLNPNQTFYRDTELQAGYSYEYRVRARQSGSPDSYSDYSGAVAGTVMSAPAAPTNLAVGEYQDTWIRLTWTKTTGEAAYEIYRATSEGGTYTKVGTVTKGVEYYKVKNLTAGTSYFFKIRAVNAAGNSAYTAAIAQNTRAAYLPSAFENLCRMTGENIYHLIEISPRMVISGWNLTAGKTLTYEYAISDDGVDFTVLAENGVALTSKSSTTAVEAAAGSFYCDYYNRKLYVHSISGADPADFLYIATFTLYFTTYQDGTAVFNNHLYLPLNPGDGVPGCGAQLSPKWEGGLTINAGALALVNPWLKKKWTFDQAFSRYLWTNARVKVLAGGDGFTYSQFSPWATGTITEDYELIDERFNFPLRDTRDALAGLMLPLSFYTPADFPLADTSIHSTRRPFAFGVVVGAIPRCIDLTSRIYEFHAGRCKSVEAVYKNDVALSAGTDYFIDYQRGRITLARGLDFQTSDKITVDFTGAVDDMDTAIKNGGLMFLYGLQNFAGLGLAEINLDTIYETAEGSSVDLAFYLFSDKSFGDFTARIERSILAFSYQDGQGRIGLKTTPATAPSNVIYVGEQYVTAFSMKGGKDSRYREIQVCYNESQGTEKFQYACATLNTMTWKYGVQGTLDVETALTNLADAETLRASIIAALDRPEIDMTIKRILYPAEIGDVFYLTRGRYFSTAGTAANVQLRITGLDKSADGNIAVRAEEVR
jgi:fibronectin type 3 domain-containing protein